MLPLNQRQIVVLRLIAVNLLLLSIALYWARGENSQSVDVAVAKGKQMLDLNTAGAPVMDILAAKILIFTGKELIRPTRSKNWPVSVLAATILSSSSTRKTWSSWMVGISSSRSRIGLPEHGKRRSGTTRTR